MIINTCSHKVRLEIVTNLDKSDCLRLLAETLAAKIEAVFTDKTSLVGTKPAVTHPVSYHELLLEHNHKYSPLTTTLSKLSWT